MYKAQVLTDNSTPKEYIGMTGNSFQERFNNYTKSFNNKFTKIVQSYPSTFGTWKKNAVTLRSSGLARKELILIPVARRAAIFVYKKTLCFEGGQVTFAKRDKWSVFDVRAPETIRSREI